jgi:transposase-like protein
MSGKPWSEDEKEALRRLYGTIPASRIASQLGRGLAATHSQADALGLRSTCRACLPDAIRGQILTLSTQGYNDAAIARQLGVHAATVRQYRLRAGIGAQVRCWMPEEKELLRREYCHTPTRLLAQRLGRNVGAVRAAARLQGLTSAPPAPAWSDAEKKTLRRLYGTVPTEEIGRHLGRSAVAVQGVARKLGLQGAYRKPRLSFRPERACVFCGRQFNPCCSRQRFCGQPCAAKGWHAERIRDFAARSGWPGTLRPLEILLLNLLAASGVPLTHREIEKTLGYGRRGVAAAAQGLVRHGFLLRLPWRLVRGSRPHGGQPEATFTLGPQSLVILEERIRCEKERTTSETK